MATSEPIFAKAVVTQFISFFKFVPRRGRFIVSQRFYAHCPIAHEFFVESRYFWGESSRPFAVWSCVAHSGVCIIVMKLIQRWSVAAAYDSPSDLLALQHVKTVALLYLQCHCHGHHFQPSSLRLRRGVFY